MKDESADDPPVEQRMRVMTLLDFAPGRAKDPEVGPPIGVLITAQKGEIEQPMMFLLADVRRLAINSLIVLASFGDDTAEEIVTKYYGACEGPG